MQVGFRRVVLCCHVGDVLALCHLTLAVLDGPDTADSAPCDHNATHDSNNTPQTLDTAHNGSLVGETGPL